MTWQTISLENKSESNHIIYDFCLLFNLLFCMSRLLSFRICCNFLESYLSQCDSHRHCDWPAVHVLSVPPPAAGDADKGAQRPAEPQARPAEPRVRPAEPPVPGPTATDLPARGPHRRTRSQDLPLRPRKRPFQSGNHTHRSHQRLLAKQRNFALIVLFRIFFLRKNRFSKQNWCYFC